MKIYPRVFFQDFIVLVFIAKSLVYFELIFVCVLTEGPSFLLFACASPHAKLPSTTSWKDCPFPTGWSWHPCWRSRAMCVWVHLRALNSSLLVYMSSLVTIPHCLNSCSFVVSLISGNVSLPTLLFVLKFVLVFRVLCTSIWIWGLHFLLLQIGHWNFDRNHTDTVDKLGECCHFNNRTSSDPWTQCVFSFI